MSRFSVARQDGRYTLVTPDGDRFVSLGVNHLGAVQEKSKVDVFAGRYRGDWHKFLQAATQNLEEWGFNTVGYHAPKQDAWPYVEATEVLGNAFYLPAEEFAYADVFDPKCQAQMRARIGAMCGRSRHNGNLIGYYWTDTPHWDLSLARKRRGIDWVSFFRGLGGKAPGKREYVAFLKRRYAEDAAALNRAYGLQSSAFDDLLDHDFRGLELDREEVAQDDQEFLRLIARTYYRVVGEANREHDPNHLVLGEKYIIVDCPEHVLREALPYIDVLSIQPYKPAFDGAAFDRLYELAGKPIIICDHQSSFATQEYPRTMWPQLESEEAAGKAYAQYLRDAFAKPYVIGYHRCQYIDRFVPRLGILKQGLIREDETPYETLIAYVQRANRDIQRQFCSGA